MSPSTVHQWSLLCYCQGEGATVQLHCEATSALKKGHGKPLLGIAHECLNDGVLLNSLG